MWARKRAAWDGWYKKQRWRNWSRLQLQEHPLCCMCLDNGIVMEATVADHIIPHHGDEQMFWFGKLQSLCRPHHDGRKQQQEKKGYANDIGIDGWPVDQKHPVYRA